jgi:hypothetical protein
METFGWYRASAGEAAAATGAMAPSARAKLMERRKFFMRTSVAANPSITSPDDSILTRPQA